MTSAGDPGYGFGFATSLDTQNPSSLYPHHPESLAKDLIAIAQQLVGQKGKGIYATDETPDGIASRLQAVASEELNAKNKNLTEEDHRERRKKWRADLYETLPTDYISGVILHSETLHDFSLAPLLTSRHILPGIRADTDSHSLPSSPSEPATQGLDSLLPRLLAAHADGARFSKWRAPILCNSSNLPSQTALETQADSLARFASISQQAGLVPIVEPDVDFSSDASLTRSLEIHAKIISLIYARCIAHGVLLEATLIKPSFVQPGVTHASRASITPDQVALAIATALARSLPIGVAGVVFLSGGLPDETAVAYLNALNRLKNKAASSSSDPTLAQFARLPPLSFSFGRGLQGSAMQKWVHGDIKGARSSFESRAKQCYLATKGEL